MGSESDSRRSDNVKCRRVKEQVDWRRGKQKRGSGTFFPKDTMGDVGRHPFGGKGKAFLIPDSPLTGLPYIYARILLFFSKTPFTKKAGVLCFM